MFTNSDLERIQEIINSDYTLIAYLDCKRLIDREGENPQILFKYGIILKKLGKIEESIKYLEKTIRSNGNEKGYAALYLGYIYQSKEDYIKAVEYFDNAISFFLEQVKTLFEEYNKYKDSSILDIIDEIHSKIVDAYIQCAEIAESSGKIRDMNEFLARAREIDEERVKEYLRKKEEQKNKA